MIVLVALERYVPGTTIFRIVVYKLRYQSKPYIVILFKVNKSSEIHIYGTILTFGLIFNLKIKSNK